MPEFLQSIAEQLAIPRIYAVFCLVVFVNGALIGSFLNVCIYRMPLGMSVNRPRRSFCFRCGTPIKWYDNIPVLSWFFLGGRDRACGAKFSPRYALVELLTGLLFLWIFLVFNPYGAERFSLMAFWYMAFAAMLVVGIFTDFDHWIIPTSIPRWGTAAGILAALVAGFIDRPGIVALCGPFPQVREGWGDWFNVTVGVLAGPSSQYARAANVLWWEPAVNSAFGAAFGYTLLKSISVVGKFIFRREAMGLGDADLFMLIGATMGAQNCLLILFAASIVGSTLGGAPIVAGWIGRLLRREVPVDASPLKAGAWDEEAHLRREREETNAALARLHAYLDVPPDESHDEERTRQFAESLQMEFTDLAGVTAPEDGTIAPDILLRLRAVPLKITAKSAKFAVGNPLNTALVAELREITGRNLQFAVATDASIADWCRSHCLPRAEEQVRGDGVRPLWRRYAEAAREVPMPRQLHHLPFIPSIAVGALIILIAHERVVKFLGWLIVPGL